MTNTDPEQEMEAQDPLQGAVEHDGTKDAFREASGEIDDVLGIDDGDAEAMPNDDAAADDAMP